MMTDPGQLKRLATGISGFDQVAMGGLSAGRSTLVTGTTGSGKTLFAMEFLARGILNFDQHGVYVTFEETPDDIRRNAASLGFDVPRWEAEGKWVFVDASADLVQQEPIVGAYDLGALAARIEHAAGMVSATRVSVDSLAAIFTHYYKDVGFIRHELYRLTAVLDRLGLTGILTAERVEEYGPISRHGIEEFILDNVVVLRNVLRRERRRRTVEVVKLRGAQHRTGEWLFTLDPRDGIVIIPLAFLISRPAAAQHDRVSSGNTALDEMLHGGLYKDSITLVTGPTGTGKTLTSLFYMNAAFEAGERCLLYSFDETREQTNRSAVGWGLDLGAMEAARQLRLIADYPEVASLEDHFIRLRRSIEEFHPDRLVIDSLSALERIVQPRALLDFIIAMGALVRQHGITTLLTSAPTSRYAGPATPAIAMEIASLTDVTVLLRYFERAGEVRRCITVLQSRGSDHDHRIRQVTIDNTGMHIGEPVTEAVQIVPGLEATQQGSQWSAATDTGEEER